MNKERILKTPILPLLLYLLILAVSLSIAMRGSEPRVEVPEGSLRSVKSYEVPENASTQQMQGIIVTHGMTSLCKESTLVVSGTVSYIHEPILVRNYLGAVSAHIDVEVSVNRVYRGEADGETIVLRLPGGPYRNYNYVYRDVPDLTFGQEYLFFLYRSAKGFGTYTKGGQYYLRGMSEGVFLPYENDGGTVRFQNCAAEEHRPRAPEPVESFRTAQAWEAEFSEEELEDFCNELNRTCPFDEYKFAEQRLETYKSNWKNGVFNKAGYEENLASVDKYAVEITEEELRELEEESAAEKEYVREHRTNYRRKS